MSPAPPANLNCILLNACGAASTALPRARARNTADTIYSPNVPLHPGPGTAAEAKA